MNDDARIETEDLAARFLRVWEAFAKLMRPPKPPNEIGRLSLNHLHALRLLYEEPGIAQKDLAERLGITPAAVSIAVREMEAEGFIERQRDVTDERLFRLYLNSGARERIRMVELGRCQAVVNLLDALPLEEQRMVVEALERAVKAKQEEVKNNPR